ncbi:hypothetical protein GX51_03186 [Blastomyces parvus]|uniref:Uncharacterized protein n=1 Tax=Blastomyces parvus TaxID=2060905 RepID=A0A2B7X8V8_9EURO|nr:hypothetical protein GX51_03186 [Blastomyces parvus]
MDASPRHVVEAQSYAPLIELASNPPRYPKNPSKAPLKPLVLYIVRVPGSRDVFLSPLKPPTESSISPALINAALYYIHVATPDDEAVLRAIEAENRLHKPLPDLNRTVPPFGTSAPIQRKPLPGAELKPPSIPRRPVTSDANMPFQPGVENEHHQPRTFQAPGSTPGRSPEPQRRPISAQRPLPPIPSDPNKHVYPNVAPNHTDIRPRTGRLRHDAQPGNPFGGGEHLTTPTAPQGRASWDGGRPSILPEQNLSYGGGHPRLSPERSPRDHQRTPPGFFQQGRRRSVEKTKEPPSPFHLTLIRRDTTNDIQWNVGNITNCTSQSSPEVACDGTITIEILTLGYQKLAAERIAFASKQRPNPTANGGADDSRRFIRHLTLTNPQSHRQGGHGRHHSNASINSLPPLDQTPTTKETPSTKPQRGRHYTFKSPWDGTCTFITGVNGRSLKCKHTIPFTHPSLAGLNLQDLTNTSSSGATTHDPNTPPNPYLNLQKLQSALEASAATAAASASSSSSPDSQQGTTVTAAELRFNLPIFPTPLKNHQHQHTQHEKYHHHHHHHHHHHPYTPSNTHTHPTRAKLRSQVEELAGRLDLSLGRERAGGGAFGKSAKLGKLIIEDEGLKMLDLVVAACMGVWWGVYDNLS